MSSHSTTNSKAVILAAGKGTRLSSITGEKPKCLVKVCGKPILQYQIEAFSDAGIEEIIVIAGYKAEDVKSFLEIFSQPKIRIIENKDFGTTNNMYSLWLAREDLLSQGDFVLCNGDVVFDGSIVSRLMRFSPDCIVCDRGKYNKESMKVSIGMEGFINDISKSIPARVAFGNSIDVYYFSEDKEGDGVSFGGVMDSETSFNTLEGAIGWVVNKILKEFPNHKIDDISGSYVSLNEIKKHLKKAREDETIFINTRTK